MGYECFDYRFQRMTAANTVAGKSPPAERAPSPRSLAKKKWWAEKKAREAAAKGGDE